MTFAVGFLVGVFFGIIVTLGAIGLGFAIKDRRREREACDRVLTGLRVYWKTGHHVYVLPNPLMLADIRKEEALVN